MSDQDRCPRCGGFLPTQLIFAKGAEIPETLEFDCPRCGARLEMSKLLVEGLA